MKKNAGFTLIELLVVIAIIGILSTIVLSSLSVARSKGKDAAAKSEMESVRSTAAIYLDNYAGSYGTDGTDCANLLSVFDPSVANNLNSIIVDAQAKVNSTAVCANTATAYVVALPLQNGTNWCVDSKGYSDVTPYVLTGIGSVQERVACQ